MIYWALLLHFYQPPTQVPSVLRRICDESYRPLVRLFKEHPSARVTVNVSGSLTEMLADQGAEDVIAGLRDLAERGQIEFVGSGKYHPILPLIPPDEARRQVVLNYQTNRTYFGESYAPRGFFPPEMCYSRSIVEPILETGYRWVILGGIACPVSWPLDVIHHVSAEVGDLQVLFRDDVLSNAISFHSVDPSSFIERLQALRDRRSSIYVVTAMDAETFGHHIKGWDRDFLGRVYEALEADAARAEVARNGRPRSAADAAGAQAGRSAGRQEGAVGILDREPPAGRAGEATGLTGTRRASAGHSRVRTVTISELLDLFPGGQSIDPRPSSWSTTPEDLAAGVSYPLWRHPGNMLHELQWQLLGLCVELVRTAQAAADDEFSQRHAQIARSLLDRAMHSCQFWWASRRPMWDINMINRGTLEQYGVLLNAYKAINSSGADRESKTRAYYKVIVARDIAAKIMDHLFAD